MYRDTHCGFPVSLLLRRLLVLASLGLVVIASAQSTRPLGVNLSRVADFGREHAFVNVFDQAREWMPHVDSPSAAWDSGAPIPLRPDGYPTHTPFWTTGGTRQIVRTMLLSNPGTRVARERFRFSARGRGEIRLWGAATARLTAPIDTFIEVDYTLGKALFVELERSEAADPIRGLRCVREADLALGSTAIFREEFLDYVRAFEVIRFMDWGQTNNSEVVEWSERTPVNNYTQAMASGVSWEHVAALANLTERDAWVCVPHAASDNYIRRMAGFFALRLDRGRRLYVEYSNEVWNRTFSQTSYAEQQAATRGYPGQPWEAGWRFYSARSAEVFGIFDGAFRGRPDGSLVKVLATQAASPYLGRQHLTHFHDPVYNPRGVEADALAIGPYFGSRVANDVYSAGRAAAATVPELLDSLEASLPTVFEAVAGQRELAEEFGLELVAYEAGQHLAAFGPAQASEGLVDKLIAANRDPRIANLYCEYLNRWFEGGSGAPGLMCLFDSHSEPSKYGSWGMKETMTDTLNPKFRAIKRCGLDYRANPYPIATRRAAFADPRAPTGWGIRLYPNPSSGTFTVEHPESRVASVVVRDSRGVVFPSRTSRPSDYVTTIETDAVGLAFVTIYYGGTVVVRPVTFLGSP